jgi:L-serine dehydratase
MESISVLDIFKIGIGPSSSHTLGPWKAALQFLGRIEKVINQISRLEVQLYGSLAKTGTGHGTDIAIILGLHGFDPVTFDVGKIEQTVQSVKTKKKLRLNGQHEIHFNPDEPDSLPEKRDIALSSKCSAVFLHA